MIANHKFNYPQFLASKPIFHMNSLLGPNFAVRSPEGRRVKAIINDHINPQVKSFLV